MRGRSSRPRLRSSSERRRGAPVRGAPPVRGAAVRGPLLLLPEGRAGRAGRAGREGARSPAAPRSSSRGGSSGSGGSGPGSGRGPPARRTASAAGPGRTAGPPPPPAPAAWPRRTAPPPVPPAAPHGRHRRCGRTAAQCRHGSPVPRRRGAPVDRTRSPAPRRRGDSAVRSSEASGDSRGHGSREPGRCRAHTGVQRRQPGPERTKPPRAKAQRGFVRNPGGDLLSQGASPQVPSARAGLTAVFGMGTGVSPPPWPPEILHSAGHVHSSRYRRAGPRLRLRFRSP